MNGNICSGSVKNYHVQLCTYFEHFGKNVFCGLCHFGRPNDVNFSTAANALECRPHFASVSVHSDNIMKIVLTEYCLKRVLSIVLQYYYTNCTNATAVIVIFHTPIALIGWPVGRRVFDGLTLCPIHWVYCTYPYSSCFRPGRAWHFGRFVSHQMCQVAK